MRELLPYDRRAAVAYAHRWAYGRNPAYYDYENIGGDCTNFASQCLFAGAGIMNYDPVYGWFYVNANYKAPAWTGVPYFYDFLTRTVQNRGPVGVETDLEALEPGDFVQLNFTGEAFAHTPVVVAVGEPRTLENTLVAAHSRDTYNEPLSNYAIRELRVLHILGVSPR